jgi:hypothetical protein
MAKLQFSEGMLKRAHNKGKFTLGEYTTYYGCLYMVSFFDIKTRIVTLNRLRRDNRGSNKDISFEELFEKANRLTRKEAKKRYSFIY